MSVLNMHESGWLRQRHSSPCASASFLLRPHLPTQVEDLPVIPYLTSAQSCDSHNTMHLQAFGVLLGLALRAQAAITIHYFNQASCNANTAQAVYQHAAPAAQNTGCVDIGLGGISAIYVDGIDDGCTGMSLLSCHLLLFQIEI